MGILVVATIVVFVSALYIILIRKRIGNVRIVSRKEMDKIATMDVDKLEDYLKKYE